MIDLHCHSLFSDGTDSPGELVRMAGELGLRALALTDHDTLAGLPDFLSQPAPPGLERVPGIEFGCRFLGQELHVLGLFFDPGDPVFQERVAGLDRRRKERNRKMLARLAELGMPLSPEELRASATTDLISRTHFARALVRKGHCPSAPEAFRRWIGDGMPAFVPFEDLDPGTAARWIREAGGVPLVAHPGRSLGSRFRWEEAMAELKAAGMAGFEVYYPEYGPSETRYYKDLAERLDMAPSGGSDYHGGTKPGLALGTGRGDLAVPDALLEALKARRGYGA